MKRLLPDSYQNENFVFKWSDCLFKKNTRTHFVKTYIYTRNYIIYTTYIMRNTLNELPIHNDLCTHQEIEEKKK